MPSALRTYTGAVHIHTDRSDGGGSLDDVIEAAKQCELNFVIITDHSTRGYGAENLEGWRDGILVLVGEEVTTPEGHMLAFETREEIGRVKTMEEGLEEIKRQVGTAVSIHHQLPRPAPGSGANHPPPPLPMQKADLLEIWSFMDEYLARASGKGAMQSIARPDKVILGPSRKLLWQWDRELERRRLPIIGGLNVHQRKQPLLDWKVVFPYQTAFQTICTCVQTPELPSVSLRARDLVWTALREGRSYIANRSVATEKGFRFEYLGDDDRPRQMGEDCSFKPGGRMFIKVPQSAEVILRHNGQPLFWGTADEIKFPAPMPGSYRVEVQLNRKLWILSNPIRLRDDDGVIQPTVSDVT